MEERKEKQMEENKTITGQNLDYLARKAESLIEIINNLQTEREKKLELIELVEENELKNIKKHLESSQEYRLKELEGTKSIKSFNISHKLRYANLISLFNMERGKAGGKEKTPEKPLIPAPTSKPSIHNNYAFPTGTQSIKLTHAIQKQEIMCYCAQPALPGVFRMRVLLNNHAGHTECLMVGLVQKYFKPKERGYIGNSNKEWGISPAGYTNGHNGGKGYIDKFDDGDIILFELNKAHELTIAKEGGEKVRTFYEVSGPLFFAVSFCYMGQEVQIIEVIAQ